MYSRFKNPNKTLVKKTVPPPVVSARGHMTHSGFMWFEADTDSAEVWIWVTGLPIKIET